MYSKIINPLTGRKVNITSVLGKKIIKNYLKQIGGSLSKTVQNAAKASRRRRADLKAKATLKRFNKIQTLDLGYYSVKYKAKKNDQYIDYIFLKVDRPQTILQLYPAEKKTNNVWEIKDDMSMDVKMVDASHPFIKCIKKLNQIPENSGLILTK